MPSEPNWDECCPLKINLTELSALCASMPRPLLVTGIFVKWLRLHFSRPDYIEQELLRGDIWSEDISMTKIIIDTVYRYNAAQVEGRPGIFVKRGPWKVLRYGIDDRKMHIMGGAGDTPTRYNVMYQGSHTLFCIAGEAAEVELLATEVYREFVEFGPVARMVFNFLRFTVTDIGEPSILEEATENFVVPIVISYGMQDVWQLLGPGLPELPEVTPDFIAP